ncbi:MAG: pentapeptide repeat-containing protein [Emcibacter sp.]|nr:pentapeptide repeat-containing protein [Emcibacter sp.]
MADQDTEAVIKPVNYQKYWYILMTWHGELEADLSRIEKEDRLKANRLFWHRFIFYYLTEESKKYLKDNNIYSEDNEVPFSEGQKLSFKNELEEKFYDRNRITTVLPDNWHQIKKHSILRDLPSISVDFMFDQLRFLSEINFEFYVFPQTVRFYKCHFVDLSFAHARFQNEVSFTRTTFNGEISFKHAIFRDVVRFDNAIFKDSVTFQYARFDNLTSFKEVKFDEDTSFNGTEFKDVIDFQGEYFEKEVNFINSIFKSTTNFQNRKFKYPPFFHGAEMHVDTIWDRDDQNWPKLPEIREAPEMAERAWSTLKFHMNTVMRHDYENMFFIKELEAKQMIKGGSYLLNAYEIFSNYGQSVRRPLAWLVAFFGFFFLIKVDLRNMESSENWVGYAIEYWPSAAIFSLAHSVPFLPLWRYVYSENPPPCELFWGGLQALFSLLMWFLAGLAIRNRFRLK